MSQEAFGANAALPAISCMNLEQEFHFHGIQFLKCKKFVVEFSSKCCYAS